MDPARMDFQHPSSDAMEYTLRSSDNLAGPLHLQNVLAIHWMIREMICEVILLYYTSPHLFVWIYMVQFARSRLDCKL
jgi:hypothetical protein